MQRLLFKSLLTSKRIVGCNLFVKFNFGTSSFHFQNIETPKVIDNSTTQNNQNISQALVSNILDAIHEKYKVKLTVKEILEVAQTLDSIVSNGICKKYGFNLTVEEIIKMARHLDSALNFSKDKPLIPLDNLDIKDYYNILENFDIFPNEKYNSLKFLDNARLSLKKFKPDTDLAMQLLWGSVAMCCREFYAKLGIAIISSRAIEVLYAFAASRANYEDRSLLDKYSLVLNLYNEHKEKKRYYKDSLLTDEESYENVCSDVESILKTFSQIDISSFEKKLKRFIEGDDFFWQSVKLKKINMEQEVLGKKVHFNYTAE